MEKLKKRKQFEYNIPGYAFSKVSDIIMFTYAHAYYAVFCNRNIKKSLVLFTHDFELEDTMDLEGAMVCYQRVRDKFLDEQRAVYTPTAISDIHVRNLIDVMIWAWVTFIKRHVHNMFDTERAVIMFGEYFSIDFTPDELIMMCQRFDHTARPIEFLPKIPIDFNLKK